MALQSHDSLAMITGDVAMNYVLPTTPQDKWGSFYSGFITKATSWTFNTSE